MSRVYTVKELYYTLQGEGGQAGRAAVFCRFSGCNLWTGRADDRGSATCRFCDTDFVGTDGPGGAKFRGADALADAAWAEWVGQRSGRGAGARPLVVCTGGEPLLQVDAELVAALKRRGFEIAVETNGTQHAPEGLDWICVSPKGSAPLRLTQGDELKLVFPQAEPEAQPAMFEGLSFRHFFLQPLDGPNRDVHTRMTVEYCLEHPQWRLSLQTHKLVGLP